MALGAELRTRVAEVRMILLDLHKLLLDRERAIYEQSHDAIGSPGEFLRLVLEDAQFAWLRTLSGLIVEMDELLSIRTKSGDAEGEAALQRTRSLLRLKEHGDEFESKYYAAIQDSPDVVIAHCKTERLLN